MSGLLINYVRNKLRQNRFLKNIFDTTLRCTVGEVHEAWHAPPPPPAWGRMGGGRVNFVGGSHVILK